MKTNHISNFHAGWIIGNFEPTLLQTKDFEIAHHFYNKDYKGVPHTHKIATEYNYIISGELIASGKSLKDGDIFIYEPNDVSDVTFIKDTHLIVIKTPSVIGDKYEIKEEKCEQKH